MADIVLKDRNGNPVEYPGVERIKVNTVDGEAVEFVDSAVIPEVVENLPIALDFSGGNQEIIAPDGYVVKSAIIQKPANLIPENIAEGVDIAGIIGTLAAGGGAVITGGTFAGTGGTKTINHNLGVKPDVFVAFVTNGTYTSGMTQNTTAAALYGVSQAVKDKLGITWATNSIAPRNTSGISVNGNLDGFDKGASTLLIYNATETAITIGSSNRPLAGSSATYTWFAIGGLT